MNSDNKLLYGIVAFVVLAAFAATFLRSNSTTTNVIMITVTPVAPGQVVNQPAQVAGALDNVSAALPSFADFLKTGGAGVAQAAQAAPPPGPSVTGWLDPTLGKVIVMDGVMRKMKCEGLEQNTDFNGLNESQKVIARDTCNQLGK